MAPKTAKTPDAPDLGDNNDELDQAINDLRGVLKADADGAPASAGDFGMDFPATSEASSDFGSGFDADPASEATSDFGGASDFGGSNDFGGGSDFGSGFGGGDFDEAAFGGALPNASAQSSSFSASEPGSGMQANMNLIMDIPIDVQIILGSSRMQVSSLMNLTEGAIISLDRRIGEPVDLVVNGRLIGRGEITVMEDDETRFGIRLLEVKAVAKS